ncbi:hypothetical protein SAMN04490203_3467 [Pseudomonas taetrolens]|uniref:Lipoprotein n=1 Tax=Pseudomonas taetrolens TaxID=47884 RepID=A0A0J6GV34_PSETA|nr:hypothetical protein [Pseudomonas taetrolens]KMM86148.1 hypothetical protein TU78_05915 [Pseudomonas taetrolens]SEC95467.1 hypothetical protein SAMN04490203_3467 [Pseudomonas taetrolens]SQF87512.1 Uncharacterised protein [Pseudomonas taetrolens]VEH50705.1 Uncharacterised protein [Pseudomonas taetrolens]
MNSALLVLNALALTVLLVPHFQPAPSTAVPEVEVAGTYTKPLKPQPEWAVMTGVNGSAAHLVSSQPVVSQSPQGEHWFF